MTRTVFGWIASGITVIYKLPQIIKLYKTKKSDDLSITSFIIQFIGYIFYILHGISINDLPVIFMGSCASFENLILIIMYYIYKTDIVEEDGVD